jgi:hypothetical protein
MPRKTTGRNRNDARRKIIIADPSKCYYCRSEGLNKLDVHCLLCGFPQNGTQASMRRFIWNINNKQILLEDKIKKIDNARYVLLSISILALVMTFFTIKEESKILPLGFIAVSLLYFGVWVWSKQKPYYALICGLVVYVLFLIISGILDSSSIAKGGFGKLYILISLIYGFNSVKKGLLLLKELEFIQKAVGLKIDFEDDKNSIEDIDEDDPR